MTKKVKFSFLVSDKNLKDFCKEVIEEGVKIHQNLRSSITKIADNLDFYCANIKGTYLQSAFEKLDPIVSELRKLVEEK